MKRRFPSAFPTSGALADGLLLVSGFVLVMVAMIAIVAGSNGRSVRSQDTETPVPVHVQRDLQPDFESTVATPELTQQRLSDWLDRALRREERVTRRKAIG
jgi:hypothetical protein